MSFIDELQENVIGDEEFEKLTERDLIQEANIDGYEVPETLGEIKVRIKGVLDFRNVNQDLNPNCYELATLMLELNNSLVAELASEQPNIKACENIKGSLSVLYDNVINHALVGKKFADKQSNIYKLFEKMKEGLEVPQPIKDEEKIYLQTICGVNFFQRERLKDGEEVFPNPTEQGIIDNVDYDKLPENVQNIAKEMSMDIASPKRMQEDLFI